MKYDKKIILPEDLQKISRRKTRLYVTALVLMYIFEILLAIILFNSFTKRGAISIFINTLVMTVVPYLVVTIPLRKDSTWVGEIIDSRRYEKWYFNPWIRSRSYRGTTIISLILKNGEEVFEKIVYKYEGKHDIPATRFKKRYIAVRVRNAMETAVLPETETDTVMCVVCGEVNEGSSSECCKCGHTLLKKSHVVPVELRRSKQNIYRSK